MREVIKRGCASVLHGERPGLFLTSPTDKKREEVKAIILAGSMLASAVKVALKVLTKLAIKLGVFFSSW